MLEKEEKSLDGTMAILQAWATLANTPTLRSKDSKIIPEYINKPKGAGKIACKQGFIGLDEKLADGRKSTFVGTVSKDPLTGIKSTDRWTSFLYQYQYPMIF